MCSNKQGGIWSPLEMAQTAENAGYDKVNKHSLFTLCPAIVAGVFISITFAFYITVTAGTANVSYGFAKLLGGICFSLGLTLVVVCSVNLFTSIILSIVSTVQDTLTWSKMLSHWCLVYIGNFIGALIFVATIWFTHQRMAANTLWNLNILDTASYKLQHGFTETFFLGILANLMVCLAVWMNSTGHSLLDKMCVMILPVAMFVAGGFEHSIANILMISMGILIKNFAEPDFWLLVNTSAEHYQHLTINQFVIKNLIPVTLDNIVGGMAVGLTFWWMLLKKKPESVKDE